MPSGSAPDAAFASAGRQAAFGEAVAQRAEDFRRVRHLCGDFAELCLGLFELHHIFNAAVEKAARFGLLSQGIREPYWRG